jgi:hypothetical protein
VDLGVALGAAVLDDREAVVVERSIAVNLLDQ